MNRLSVSLILLILSLSLNAQEILPGDDIVSYVDRYGMAEVTIDYPGFEEMSMLAEEFDVSSCDGKKAVLYLSPKTAEVFLSKKIPYELVKRDDSKRIIMASTVSEAIGWNVYPTYSQYDSIVHAMAEQHPDICSVDTIGVSIKGKMIFVLKISDNVTEDEDEPEVFLSSSIHGDELGGFVLMLRLASLLTEESTGDELVKRIRANSEVWINPLANPDGMYRTGDEIINPVRYNANSIDLNRNYPDPEITYTVTVQPENAAMISFMKEHHFALSANFHSGSEVVNYPWDRWSRLHADNDWLFSISRRYADTVHLHSPASYMNDLNNGVTNGAAWYVIYGGRQDYMTYSLGGREVTIELDDIKMTEATELESLWNYNYRSLIRYVSEVFTGIQGRVTDSVTGESVEAMVYIQGHDADSSFVFSDKTNGRYIRLLEPGVWALSFVADGYEKYVAEDVVVNSDETTTLDVRLKKEDKGTDKIILGPVPSSGWLNVILPYSMEGINQMTITDIGGRKLASYTDFYLPGIAIEHDFSKFAGGVYLVSVRNISSGKTVTAKFVIAKE